MISIKVTSTGNFDNTKKFLSENRISRLMSSLDKYGQLGVEALSKATPVSTGKTAESWYYKIKYYEKTGSFSITWCNSNVNITPHSRAAIAVILDSGHATRSGGYVEGYHYIKPAIRPVFDKIVKDAWREVTR